MAQPDEETTEVIGESVANTVRTVSTVRLKEYAERVCTKTQSFCQRLYVLFTKHPHENQQSYVKHALHTLRMAFHMGKGAMGLCIHSVFPFLCEKTGTNVIEQMHAEIHLKQE